MLSPTLRPLIEVTGLWLSRPNAELPQMIYEEVYRVYCRWMAAELFGTGRGYEQVELTSKETDVWALGMIVLVGISV